jgi:YVTN family beta-propeller protein
MIEFLILLLHVLVSPFKTQARLEAEVVLLRHQLNALRQRVPSRPKLTVADRLLFVWLYWLLESERICPWTRTHQAIGRSSGSASSLLSRSSADFIMNTAESSFQAQAFTPDEKYLLATNGLSNDVSVIDVASQKVVKTIQVGEQPWGVVIAEP